MKTAAVLFDMDGVIVDSLPMHSRAAQEVLRQYGFDLSADEYYTQFAGVSDEAGFMNYFERVNARVDLPTVLRQKAAEYKRLSAGKLMPCPGALEFITSLAQQGIVLGIVTGALKSEAESTLKTFKIRDFFRTLITAEDISHSKPHPEGYLRGLTELGQTPDQCIVIEDAPEGIAAATNAGLRCVAVSNTHRPDTLSAAVLVVDHLQDARLKRKLFAA